MTDRNTVPDKKEWKEPRVETLANVRETRGGILLSMMESGPMYTS